MGNRLAGLAAGVVLVGTLSGAGGIAAGSTSLASRPVQGAAALFGKPVQPHPAPGGQPGGQVKDQTDTGNWSGYVVARFETGSSYSSAAGTWTVPTAAQPSQGVAGYSASWVGIGGFCEDAACHKVDQSLIQLGTEQDVSATGVASYSAWYEMLPSAPVQIPVVVAADNEISVSLSDSQNQLSNPSTGASAGSNGPANGPSSSDGPGGGPGGPGGGGPPGGPPPGGGGPPGGPPPGGGGPGPGGSGHGGPKSGPGGPKAQSWVLSFDNITTGKSWSATVSYDSSLDSAEWIEEAPSSNQGILPLANYDSATFNPTTANGSNPNLTVSQSVIMYDPQGQTSNPSAPDSEGDGFATCWGSGSTLANCPAPS